MDPNANLAAQIRLARRILDGDESPVDREQSAELLAECVIALDEWIMGGGFLPLAWDKHRG